MLSFDHSGIKGQELLDRSCKVQILDHYAKKFQAIMLIKEKHCLQRKGLKMVTSI